MKKKISLKFENFSIKIIPPTRDLVPCNKSIMANKLLSINLEQFLRRIKSPLTS